MRIDDIVAEDDGERFVADQVARDEHRVAEPERFALADVREVDEVRDLADLGEQLLLAARFEERFELDRDVEVIFNRVLAASGDEDDVVDAGGDRLLDAVLDDRLVDQRQHLFRLRFGRGKKPSAKTGGREDGFSNRLSLTAGHPYRTSVASNAIVHSDAPPVRYRIYAMLDPAFVRDHMDDVRRRSAQSRAAAPTRSSSRLATLEARRRRLIPEIEGLKREQNAAGDEVARAKRQGQDASPIFAANKARAQQIRQLEIELDQVEQQRIALLMTMPNLPHASVPVGSAPRTNVGSPPRTATPRVIRLRAASRTGSSDRRSASSTSNARRRCRARASPS